MSGDEIKILLAVVILGGLIAYWVYLTVQLLIEGGREVKRRDAVQANLMALTCLQGEIWAGRATWQDYGNLLARIDERRVAK